jgi:hypothetical protein
MLEILQFVFSGLWHFLGTLILIGAILNGIAGIVQAFRQPAKRKKGKRASELEEGTDPAVPVRSATRPYQGPISGP